MTLIKFSSQLFLQSVMLFLPWLFFSTCGGEESNLYRNKLKNWECLKQVAIAERQNTSEDRNFETKLTPSKINSSDCLYTYSKKISRTFHDPLIVLPPLKKRTLECYPWEEKSSFSKITKEHFRCKGDPLHAGKMIERGGQKEPLIDCGGSTCHGLPLREGKEFIYPILLTLLNYLQEKTQQKVVVTSGHRCPSHNAYIDPSKENLYSKHQIGAEVSFYVENIEAELIVALLIDFYKDESKEELRHFLRYTKSDTNVSTPPWYNQEIFIKLFKPHEGRNGDNEHPFAYIAIQVRYDREKQERVIYSWDKANKNYFRK